jgi:hypothetical protein
VVGRGVGFTQQDRDQAKINAAQAQAAAVATAVAMAADGIRVRTGLRAKGRAYDESPKSGVSRSLAYIDLPLAVGRRGYTLERNSQNADVARRAQRQGRAPSVASRSNSCEVVADVDARLVSLRVSYYYRPCPWPSCRERR